MDDSYQSSFPIKKNYHNTNVNSKAVYFEKLHCNRSKETVALSENNIASENEKGNDPDVDSSGEEVDFVFEGKAKTLDGRKKLRRRTSSLFFVSKKATDQVVLDDSNNSSYSIENLEQTLNDHHDKVESQKNVLKKSLSLSAADDDSDNVYINDFALMQKDNLLNLYQDTDFNTEKRNVTRSTVDGLLFEIYDRHYQNSSGSAVCGDSDVTECSTTSLASVYVTSSFENDDRPKLDWSYLEAKGKNSILCIKVGKNIKLVKLM